MIFRRPKPASVESQTEMQVDTRTPEERLTFALIEFQQEYSDRIQSQPDVQIEKAKLLLSKAKRIVGDSGLGPALAPTLIEEVKYWPSWSQRDDFGQYVHFPATDIFGSSEKDERQRDITRVYFKYKGRQYGVVIHDHGFQTGFHGDAYHHGKAEFIENGVLVLGLDISQDTDSEFARWRWFDLYAFVTGDWMKDLIEIAAHIEAGHERLIDEVEAEDVIERSRNIKL